MLHNAVLANQEIVIFNLRINFRCEMLIVEPIFTLEALNHELLYVFTCVRLFAMAVTIEEVLIVVIFIVLVIFLFVEKLAGRRHTAVSTVAPEVQLSVQFNNVMTFMAMIHTANAESVRLQIFDKLTIIWQAFLNLEALSFRQIPNLFLIACNAGINLLIYVAVRVSASINLF